MPVWEAAMLGSGPQTGGEASSTPHRDGKIPGGRGTLVLQNHSSSILQTKAVGTPLKDTSRSLQADLSRRESSQDFLSFPSSSPQHPPSSPPSTLRSLYMCLGSQPAHRLFTVTKENHGSSEEAAFIEELSPETKKTMHPLSSLLPILPGSHIVPPGEGI